MDTGEGRFEQFDASSDEEVNEKLKILQKTYTRHGGMFRVGEELEIRGSKFKIQKLTPKKMVLKLLKKPDDWEEREFPDKVGGILNTPNGPKKF